MKFPEKIEISHKTIIFTVFFLILIWFLIQIREIIFIVFVSFIIMSALKPFADRLEKYHIPRAISVLIIYILFFAMIGYTATSFLPLLISQSIHFSEILPSYLKSIFPFAKVDVQTFSQQITPVGENLLKVTVGLFGNIVTLFTLFVISFYLLMERKNLRAHLASFMGLEASTLTMSVIAKVEERLGAWIRGQALLALTIGVFTFIGISFLGLPFALPLAILAGLLEIVPIIGPVISAIPAILIAITISPFIAVATTALYFIIQQLEAHIVVPLVMRKTVGLSPVITIISLLIGAKLAGIGGALLAIPIVVTGQSIILTYINSRSVKE